MDLFSESVRVSREVTGKGCQVFVKVEGKVNAAR